MNRRVVLFLVAVSVMIAFGALAAQQQQKPKTGLLLLDWASKATGETPPVAVLIEMGLKDEQPVPWSGRASVKGAKVVHREGYRLRAEDKLVEPESWQVSSHRGIRVPKGQPA